MVFERDAPKAARPSTLRWTALRADHRAQLNERMLSGARAGHLSFERTPRHRLRPLTPRCNRDKAHQSSGKRRLHDLEA